MHLLSCVAYETVSRQKRLSFYLSLPPCSSKKRWRPRRRARAPGGSPIPLPPPPHHPNLEVNSPILASTRASKPADLSKKKREKLVKRWESYRRLWDAPRKSLRDAPRKSLRDALLKSLRDAPCYRCPLRSPMLWRVKLVACKLGLGLGLGFTRSAAYDDVAPRVVGERFNDGAFESRRKSCEVFCARVEIGGSSSHGLVRRRRVVVFIRLMWENGSLLFTKSVFSVGCGVSLFTSSTLYTLNQLESDSGVNVNCPHHTTHKRLRQDEVQL